jgi:hypothetical protein
MPIYSGKHVIAADDLPVALAAIPVCPSSPTIPNGVFTCGTSSPVGTVCDEVTCAPGFQGTPSATCQSGGAWSVTGACERIGECHTCVS